MVQAQIFFDRDKFKDNKPMADYILEFLLANDIIGATVFRGEAGFGATQKINKPDSLFSFDEPPMVITFVDQDEKVRKVLTAFRKKVKSGFIVLTHVEIWK